MERERYCELIECNMVICFFSWSLIQNHFPHKMHRIDLPCKVLRVSALLCWAHLLSRWRALFLLRAASAAPGQRTSNLPMRIFAWLHTEKDFRSKSRQSQPPLSSPGPFYPLEVRQILLWTLQGGGLESGGRQRPRRRRRRRCRGLCQGSLT